MQLRNKLLAILALVILITATFYGATMEEDGDSLFSMFDKKKETIYFWYDDESMADYINSAAVMFGEKYKVRVLPQLVSESKYLEAINHATLHEEHMPDAYLISNDSLEKAYMAGLAATVTDASKRMNTIHFPQTALDAVTYKEKQVAYPLFFETAALLYNKAYLQEWAYQQAEKEFLEAETEATDEQIQSRSQEILANAVPGTIDDILKIADTFDPPENVDSIFKWDVSDIFFNYYFVGNYMLMGGDTGDDKVKLNINNKQVVDCLKVYKDLNQFFYIESDKVDYETVLQEFIEGKVVFTIATTDALAAIDKAKKEGTSTVEYGVAPLPDPGKELQGRSLSVTQAVAINGYSSQKELAEQFAVYLTTEYTTMLYEKSGRMAVYNFVNQNNPEFSVYHQEYENSISLPKMIETGNYWLQLEVLFSKVWNGGDVPLLVEEMAERINAQLTATK